MDGDVEEVDGWPSTLVASSGGFFLAIFFSSMFFHTRQRGLLAGCGMFGQI